MMQRRPEIRGTAWVLLVVMLASSACQAVGPGAEPAEAEWPAPRLVARSPAPGMEQPLDAAVTLTFDQAMDAESVAAALTISPTVRGALHWTDDRTAVFAPEAALARGAEYRVALTTTARSAAGKALAEPVAFDFTTEGYLKVGEIYPPSGASDVDALSPVMVSFNRPVVPLNPLERSGELPEPLVFSPTVAGRGEWVNTSTYVFHPTGKGFRPATRYTVRAPAGLCDTTGGELSGDAVWWFETVHPRVVHVSPPDGSFRVLSSDVISVTFNQEMDHESVEHAFRLLINGESVPGASRWVEAPDEESGEVFVFVPQAPLPRGAQGTVLVGLGARARAGEVGRFQAHVSHFETFPVPRWVGSAPAPGAAGVKPGYQQVRIDFAAPMDTEVFTRYLRMTPPITDIQVDWEYTGQTVSLYFYGEAESMYRVEIDGGAPDHQGIPLGRSTVITWTTGDFDSKAYLNTGENPGAFFDAYTETVAYATVINVSRLDLELYRVPMADFVSRWGGGRGDFRTDYEPDPANLIRSWSQPVTIPHNTYRILRVDLTDGDGQDLPPGAYFVRMSAPEVLDKDPAAYFRWAFVRSRFNLTVKQTRDAVLVWANDLASGKPAGGLPLRFALQAEILKGPGAETDAAGLYQGTGPISGTRSAPYSVVWSGEPGEDNFAVTVEGWNSGIEVSYFNVSSEFSPALYQGAIYTDRPIYRPGQTVYFKGIVRAYDGITYSVPVTLSQAWVGIEDESGESIYSSTFPLNDLGTFHGELTLDTRIHLGHYRVRLHTNEAELAREWYWNQGAIASFKVEEYQRAPFQVAVMADRSDYMVGDVITVTAEASYYFGGPVAGAPVHWNILREDYRFQYPCAAGARCSQYRWTDPSDVGEGDYYSGYGWLVGTGDGRMDAQGRITFQVPAELGRSSSSQRFTIEVMAADPDAQLVSARTQVVVHRGRLYVGAALEKYLTTVGEAKTVELMAVPATAASTAVSASTAGVSLTVVFMEHRWYSVRQRAENGRFYWTSQAEDLPVFTTTVRTDADGKARATYTPEKAGVYRVRVLGRDSQGQTVSASIYFWVWDQGVFIPWKRASDNRIQLVADKSEYQVGEVARILVSSPFSGTVQALVTVERSGIFDREVRELPGNGTVLEIPIRADYQPNVFVSVVLIQGAQQSADGMAGFKMGMVELPVRIDGKALQVTLTPKKDPVTGAHYSPRRPVTYEVRVTDAEGKPVEAELSWRLADLAVLALGESDPKLLQLFWRSRGCGVRTSLALSIAMAPFNQELAPRAKGGGGGGGVGGMLRTNFVDTAFWDPAVRTDKDGRAEVTVTLPDNLTTWRMQVQAVTADARVGWADADIVSTLDLLVQPMLPRFFMAGDRVRLGTTVHNLTGISQTATVAFQGNGLTLDGGAARQTVSVPAGGRAQVFWPVVIQAGAEATIKMEVWTEGGVAPALYDAQENRLPVYRYSTPEVVATAGQLDSSGARMEVVNLPRNFDPTQGELTVRMEGSLIAAVQEPLTYLEAYPYGCTEQTVSRFLPQLMMYRTLQETGMASPELKERLTLAVYRSFQRLEATTNYPWSWGWWDRDYSSSDPFLTAYVLQGFLEAKRAGFDKEGYILARIAQFLRESLRLPDAGAGSAEFNRQAYLLYVLAEYSESFPDDASGELGMAVTLFEHRDSLGYYGKALLARALALLEPQEPARVATLLNELEGAAHRSAIGVHWEETTPDSWNMNTDIRTTAMVIWAFSALRPESELLPGSVRWLMAARRDGIWGSTQETAWAVMALATYARTAEDPLGDFGYRATLNGRSILAGAATPGGWDPGVRTAVGVAELATGTSNTLVIERSAGAAAGENGRLYYEATLRTYQPAETVPALDRGISISRQYSRIDAVGIPITSTQVGEEVMVRLILVVPQHLRYVMVEDPLPAGFESVNTSLKTTSVVGQAPSGVYGTESRQRGLDRNYGWGWWWFTHVERHDERTTLFAEYLPAGTYEYTYRIRAIVPGEFRVLPAVASEMYFPEVFGRSAGTLFMVQP